MEKIITVIKQSAGTVATGLTSVNSLLSRGTKLKHWQDHGEFILFHIETDRVVGLEETDIQPLTMEYLGEL